MIIAQLFLALAVAILVEAFMLAWLDRRIVRREAEFWEDLRRQALDGYQRAFDWERD